MPTTNVLILEKSGNERRYTLGVVYEPNSVDAQGDFAKAETIETAAWDFMSRLQAFAKSGAALVKAAVDAGKDGIELDITDIAPLLKGAGDGLDDQHLQVDEQVGTVVESYIAPTDMVINDQTVKKGAWLMGVIWTPEMFDKIKKGERTGLSMFGRASAQES